VSIAALADGESLGPGALAHVARCDDCLEKVTVITQLLRDHDIGKPVAASACAPQGWKRMTRTPPWRAAVAASVLLFVSGLVYRYQNPSPTSGLDIPLREVRGGGGAAQAVPVLRMPQDGQELRRSDLHFNWTAVDNAIYYQMELLSADGDVLWQEQMEGTDATPPESLYLAGGATHYAWVRAHLRDGKTVKSQAVSFRIIAER
jgi:hypothetical protein